MDVGIIRPAPVPWTIRARMSCSPVVAKPPSTEPMAKISIAPTKVSRIPKISIAQAASSMVTVDAAM